MSVTGSTVAILTAQTGVERAELEEPMDALIDAGATVVHLAPEVGPVQSMVSDTHPDVTFAPDQTIASASIEDFDLLILPGGTVNADTVRGDAASVALVTQFVDAGKPIAAVCHGPWALVEAGVLPGKTLTSFPTLRTDITNAGGTWVDEEVIVCAANDWNLITSRSPADLDAFIGAICQLLDEPS